MSTTRIKICGITSVEDAEVAVQAGVDAIGLVFYAPSPRAVSVELARTISAQIPPFVSVVGLFVDSSADEVAAVLSQVSIDMLQFHGAESPAFCAQFERPWIKALRVRPELDLAQACDAYRDARGVLLDAWHDELPGGTGEAFDWTLIRGSLALPVVLAGGLNDENVATAVARVRPAAVDVSSGVESAPGKKDAARIHRFVAAVRSASGE